MAVGILSLLAAWWGQALLFQHAFAEQFDTDLSRTVEAIAVGYEHSADPQPELLNLLYALPLRITLRQTAGAVRPKDGSTVLDDSATSTIPDRPAQPRRPPGIQQAMAEGTGASTRRKQTLGTTPIIMPCA